MYSRSAVVTGSLIEETKFKFILDWSKVCVRILWTYCAAAARHHVCFVQAAH
jgi:hypothetical protein